MAPQNTQHIEILEDRIAPAIFTVINLLDHGAGSLRDAVSKADNTLGTDTIVFKTTGNILLTTGEIATTGNLIIKGPAHNAITVDGNLNGRIFDIKDGDSTKNSPVSISNIAFIDGNVANTVDPNGGAIFSTESLTLSNCVVANNRGDFGAGVAVMGGTGSSVKIINSIFTGNVNSNSSMLSQGGGLAAFFTNTLSITGSHFFNNSANQGAGVYATNLGTGKTTGITISSSVFSGGVSRNGAGVFLVDETTGAKAQSKIVNSSFSNNTASIAGGGLLLEGNHFVVQGTVVNGNSAAGEGGGIEAFVFNTLAVISSKVTGNLASGSGASGGGLYLFHDNPGTGTVLISSSNIGDNSAPQGSGGGVFAKNDTNLTILASSIAGNSCSGNGAGLNVAGPLITVTGGTISGNIAGNDGGGIYSTSNGVVKITSASANHNVGKTAGGFIFFSGAVAVEINKSTLGYNEGVNEGGAIYEGGGHMTLTSDLVVGNGTNSLGGGIYVAAGGANLVETQVVSNVSNDIGGGIYSVNTGAVTLGLGTVVVGNVAELSPNTFNV